MYPSWPQRAAASLAEPCHTSESSSHTHRQVRAPPTALPGRQKSTPKSPDSCSPHKESPFVSDVHSASPSPAPMEGPPSQSVTAEAPGTQADVLLADLQHCRYATRPSSPRQPSLLLALLTHVYKPLDQDLAWSPPMKRASPGCRVTGCREEVYLRGYKLGTRSLAARLPLLSSCWYGSAAPAHGGLCPGAASSPCRLGPLCGWPTFLPPRTGHHPTCCCCWR